MSAVFGLLFVLLYACAGLAAARWLDRASPTLGPIGVSGLAYGIGISITGVSQLALSAFGVPTQWMVPTILAIASLGATAVVTRRKPTESAPASNSLPRRRRLLVACGVPVLIGVVAAAGTPFQSDGSSIWGPKAREMARAGATEMPSLHEAERLGIHRAYPLLVPALLAPVFDVSPQDAAAGPKLVLAAANVAVIFLLGSVVLRQAPQARLLVLVVCLAPVLTGLNPRESPAIGGHVDGVLAHLVLVHVYLTRCLLPQRRWLAPCILAGVVGAAVGSAKLEGAVIVLVVLASEVLAHGMSRRVVLSFAITVLGWLPSIVIAAGVVNEGIGFDLRHLVDLEVLRARWPTVVLGLADLMLDASSFLLLPCVLILWTWGGRVSPERRQFFLIALAILLFLLVSYFCTAMNAGRHMHTSAHRLLWQWLPALTLLAALVPRTATPRTS